MSATAEEILLDPKDLDEVKELLSKLSIHNLRAFCFTFGLSQDGAKPKLIETAYEILHRERDLQC